MSQLATTKVLVRWTVSLSLLALTLLGCGPSAEADGPEAPVAETEPAAEVEYEPAYPEEVSSEELSEADTAQAEASHDSDDGHSHGLGTHTHDEDDEEHEHEDGEDDHEH